MTARAYGRDGMRVYVSNNSGREARKLAVTFPGRVGHLYSPGGFRGPFDEFPHALDNGCFKRFNWRALCAMLDRARAAHIAAEWVAVPDVVADAEATLRRWRKYAAQVAEFGFPLAFVAQDGHTPADVPADAAVVFVGGSTEWKRANAAAFCRSFPRVHIGRVNTARWLAYFDSIGAESVDGTGFFRGDRSQLDALWYYLADSEGLDADPADGPLQRRLFAAGAA